MNSEQRRHGATNSTGERLDDVNIHLLVEDGEGTIIEVYAITSGSSPLEKKTGRCLLSLITEPTGGKDVNGWCCYRHIGKALAEWETSEQVTELIHGAAQMGLLVVESE